MSGSERFKNGFKNPIVFGTAAGILVILFNILIASLAEGSLKEGFSVFLTEYKDAIIIIGLLDLN